MFKKLVILLSLVALLISPMNVFAASLDDSTSIDSSSISELNSINNDLKSLTFDYIENNPDYQDLPKDEEFLALCKEINDFKNKNSKLSTKKIANKYENRIRKAYKIEIEGNIKGDISTQGYDIGGTRLTAAEIALIASNPAAGYITKQCAQKAVQYTYANYGESDIGDTSDAFRHGIWNALMCKYISKAWAYEYGTAHEALTAAELKGNASDGYPLTKHKKMDLHNNQKGRDCWSVLKDTIPTTSDGTLQNRIIAKIRNGEMIILHN